jgi:hypothetical protein
MEALLDCLADENVEVREMASKALSGVVRCSQRQSIVPLKVRFLLSVGGGAWIDLPTEPLCGAGTEVASAGEERPRICRRYESTALCNSWPVCTYRELPLHGGDMDAPTD